MDIEAARRSTLQEFKTASAQEKAMIAKEKAKMAGVIDGIRLGE